MKKTFPIEIEGKKPERVVDSIKHEINKYVKRERKKKLPEGADFWDFDCKVGVNKEEATPKHVAEVSKAIDGILAAESKIVYIEVLAKPAARIRKPKGESNRKPTPQK